MPATKGNRFWEVRSKHGRDKIFSDPEVLWKACVEYFEWTEDNPLEEQRAYSTKDGIQTVELNKMRAMTINGLCVFLDINQVTWREYYRNKDFSRVCQKAEAIIREQKFTGAAANLLNPVIIARDLGLVERLEHSGDVNTTIKTITSDMDANQAADVWLEILRSESVPQAESQQIEDKSEE